MLYKYGNVRRIIWQWFCRREKSGAEGETDRHAGYKYFCLIDFVLFYFSFIANMGWNIGYK